MTIEPQLLETLFDDKGKPYYTMAQAIQMLKKQYTDVNIPSHAIHYGCVSRSEIMINRLFKEGVHQEAIGRVMMMAPRGQPLSVSNPLYDSRHDNETDKRRQNPHIMWDNHVAPSLRVLNPETGTIIPMVLDPVVDVQRPLDIFSWKKKFQNENALVLSGALGQLMLASPEFLTETQLSAVNPLLSKLNMNCQVSTRKDFGNLLSGMSESQQEIFEARFQQDLNIMQGLAYNVWCGQELNGKADMPDVRSEKFPDWNELEFGSEQWEERFQLAVDALQPLREYETSIGLPGRLWSDRRTQSSQFTARFS